MAKGKSTEKVKVKFGQRKGGKPKKLRGPKEKEVSKYRGQGR